MKPRAKTFLAALAAFIIVILVAAPEAQQQPAFAGSAAPAARAPDRPTDIDLLVGRSTILNVGSPITRVSLTVPDIADAMVTTPTQLLIHGKQPGTISLFVWDRGGAITSFEVNVRRDLSALVEQMKQLFPGEPVSVTGSGKDVVISGIVSSTYVIEKAADVASGYVEKKENVVNLLKRQEGIASNQVMLRVRFAEVSRSALQDLGASFFANGFKQDWLGRTAAPGVTGPDFDKDRSLVFSDFLNLFVFNSKEGLGGVVKALQTKGLFQSLAEPNLIATSGKEASFLAGGEFPYPVVQASSNGNAVTIMFKEFGVRLNFTPTVLGGDLIHLKVRPEVSSLDFANGVTVSGFRVPALTTRRTETEVELRDGQTFAIAGLMNNTVTSTMSKIPGIGDIPILGLLFRSKAHQKNQTELVVMITPTIIMRGQPGVSQGLPSMVEPFLGAPGKTLPPPDPYVGSPRYPANQPRPSGGAQKSAPQPQEPGVAVAPQPVPAPIQQPAVVQSQPIAASVPMPVAPAAVAPETSVSASQPASAEPAPPKPTKRELAAAAAAEKKRVEAQERETEQQKAADQAEAKRLADQAKKDEKQRQQSAKLEQARARHEAAVAKKSAEVARKKALEDQKRQRALDEAAARLKQAQSAYQAEIDKAKGNSNDKAKGPGRNDQAPSPRH